MGAMPSLVRFQEAVDLLLQVAAKFLLAPTATQVSPQSVLAHWLCQVAAVWRRPPKWWIMVLSMFPRLPDRSKLPRSQVPATSIWAVKISISLTPPTYFPALSWAQAASPSAGAPKW